MVPSGQVSVSSSHAPEQVPVQAPVQALVQAQAEGQAPAQTPVMAPVTAPAPAHTVAPTLRRRSRTPELRQSPRESRDAAMLFHAQSCKRWALSGNETTNLITVRSARSSPARRRHRDRRVLVGTNIYRTGLVLKQDAPPSDLVSALSPKSMLKSREAAVRRPRLQSTELALRSLFTSEAQGGPASLHAARWHNTGAARWHTTG